MRMLLLVLMLLVVTGAQSARGQYLFLDTNGDGTNSPLDLMKVEGWNLLDVWLVTDCNRDGTAAQPARSGPPLGMFSYEFVLHAENGTVEWGRYENLMPQFGFSFGTYKNGSDFYTGFSGTQTVAPGRYRIGRIPVRATGGAPRIGFGASSTLSPVCHTSFGSLNPGRQDDNTIRFGDAVIPKGCTAPWADWYDADGAIAEGNAKLTRAIESTPARFGVDAIRNGARSGFGLRIRTTVSGPVRVRLYDVGGRMVGTLIDEPNIAAGTMVLPLGHLTRHMPAGVIFYEVQASEGTARGKLAVLR